MIYIADIETKPAPVEEQALFEPAFSPRGNLKDPGKIAADIEAKREAWRETAQLDAMRLEICAVGIMPIEGAPVLLGVGSGLMGDLSEQEIIKETWARFAIADQVVMHNSGYDLGILAQRSAIHDIPVPKLTGFNPNFYDSKKFVCTKELWKPKGSNGQTPASLDMIGKALGVGGKPEDASGKDFWTWGEDPDKQRVYLTWDLKACAEIYRRMGGAQ